MLSFCSRCVFERAPASLMTSTSSACAAVLALRACFCKMSSFSSCISLVGAVATAFAGGCVDAPDLWFGSVRLFIHSETGSRIFAGCRLLTSRRVDDWVSTYHSWEQPRCPQEGLQLKGSGIHAPARPLTPRRPVQGQPTCPPALLSQSLKDPHLPYVTRGILAAASQSHDL